MSDPNYYHEFDPNRKGRCKFIGSEGHCHKLENDPVHSPERAPQQPAPAQLSTGLTLRERLAKALWDSENAEERRRKKDPALQLAEWPTDSERQPYCRSTYRQADFLLPFFDASIAAAVEAERKVLQAALDWDAEYRAINNLGKGVPHWVSWAKEALNMVGHYEPPADSARDGLNAKCRTHGNEHPDALCPQREAVSEAGLSKEREAEIRRRLETSQA